MDREIMMLAAKVVEADHEKLGAAIKEVIKAKKTLAEIGGTTYYTPDSICGYGGFLEKIGVDLEKINPKHDPAAYWKVSEGVQLTRYRATNVTRLIAVRKGREGNDDVIFEIFINRKTKKATIKRDDTVLFTIGVDGLSAGRLQTAAISVLRSYLRQNDHSHQVTKRIRHRRAEERKAESEKASVNE